MPPKQNSGTRLQAIFEAAAQTSQKGSCAEVWTAVLALPTGGSHLDQLHLAAEALGEVADEMQLMKAQLLAQGVPAEMVNQYVERAQLTLAVGNLTAPWTSVSSHLAQDVLLALRWFGYVLPTDADAQVGDDLLELKAALDDVKSSLQQPGIPGALAALVEKQLAAIDRALQRYQISGIAPLRDAARRMTADLHFEQDEFRAAAALGDPEAVATLGSKLGKAWRKTVEVSEGAGKIASLGKTLLDLGEAARKLLSPTP